MKSTLNDKLSDLPLISIVVITYNSAKYILETLESIKKQTYANIELVISDDCSKDNTVALCEEWVASNRRSFAHVLVVNAEKNGGIPANCNQGLKHSTGEWIKLIAGDDFLLPDCIDVFFQATLQYPDASCFVSDMYVLHNGLIDQIYQIRADLLPKNASQQLYNFIRYKSLPGPALFIKKYALFSIGGFDEKYPGMEDYPMCIAMVQAGYYFVAINTPTVIYRSHAESVSHSGDFFLTQSANAHFDSVIKPLIKSKRLYFLAWHYYLENILIKSIAINRVFISLFIRFTDIIYWENKLLILEGNDIHSQARKKPISPIKLSNLLD